MTEFIVSLEQLQKLADKLEPEPKETYKVKITLPKIVRCKDCKYYMPTMYTPFSNEALCYGLRTEEDCGMTIVNPDGYCAWGERKQ